MAERAEMDKVQKHILIFSTAYLPLVGGAELAVKEITDRLPEYRFSLVTARLKRGLAKREKIGQVEVFRLGLGWSLDKFLLAILGPFWAFWRFKNDPPTMIWGIMASFGGLAASAYKKRTGVPFLLTLQEGDNLLEVEEKARILGDWFRQIFTRTDAIQAISTYLKDWALKMGAACPIEVIPNGAEIAQNSKRKTQSDIFRVVTASRLVDKNGLEYLIKAIKILQDKYGSLVILKILGDGKLRKKLEKLVDDLKIKDRVVLLGVKQFKEKGVGFEGEVSNEKVYEYLSQANVFCRPSLSEGLGNAFLEAMAVGVPVVATPVGGIPDFLKDGETGWFCRVKDPESIAEKINYILDPKNKVEVERVVDNAYKLVEEKYNWGKISQDMKNIFNFLTNV